MGDALQKHAECIRHHAEKRIPPGTVSVILYGSTVYGHKTNKDLDMCIVLNDPSIPLVQVKNALNKCFVNADVRFYHLHELQNPLFFRDINNGTFAVEYLAGGVSVIGENPFVALLSKISKPAYRRSLKQKMFDYVLRIRRVYLNKKRGTQELAFVRKYVRRIIIDLFLFNEVESFKTVNEMDLDAILALAVTRGLLDSEVFAIPPDQQEDRFTPLFSLTEYLADVVFHLPDEPFAADSELAQKVTDTIASPAAKPRTVRPV